MTEVTATKKRKREKKQDTNTVCKSIKKILLKMFVWFRFYLDLLIDRVFSFFYDPFKQQVCPADHPILLESATSIARKIRNREITAEEVVRAFISRIKQVNSILNAVVDNRFKEAIEEAKNIDKQIEIGEITDIDFREKPFLGVPFTSKESTAAEGMSFTFGIFARKGRKATEDAEIVRLMKSAGAILLGVTNIPQLNMWQETMNPIYGLTRNPYNTSRNVGGSSGGEASIIAAGGSPMGLGTDIGGSLRIPAFMCGIFGHKPTCNLINTKGMTFRTGKKEESESMVVPGPMTRYAEDIIPMLKVLMVEEAAKLDLDKPVDIESLNVYYIEDPRDPTISTIRDEMKECMQKVVKYFGEILPQKPRRVDFKGIRYGGKLWRYSMTKEPNSNFVRDLTDRKGQLDPLVEIIKYTTTFERTFSLSSIYNMANRLMEQEDEEWAHDEIKILRRQILDKIGKDGVLLYPSAPFPASYHYTAFLRPWNFSLFCIWNALKLPVTQVPLGLSSEGLPLGIQVISAKHNDRLTIAVAKILEKKFGGYVPPFKMESY